MPWLRFRRDADSRIQQNRRPIQSLVDFRSKVEQCVGCLRRDPARAVPLAVALTEMEPERGLPWLLLAQALGESGRPAEALDTINRALLIDPTDCEKWAVKAYALGDLGRQDEAAEAVAEAKRLRERERAQESSRQGDRTVFRKSDE